MRREQKATIPMTTHHSRPWHHRRAAATAIAGAALVSISILPAATHAAPPTVTPYSVTLLSGTGKPVDVSANGHVAATVPNQTGGLTTQGAIARDGQTAVLGLLVAGEPFTSVYDAVGINSHDQVIGEAFNLEDVSRGIPSVRRPVLWENGSARDVAPGSFIYYRETKATGINDAGQIVGFAKGPFGAGPSIAWTAQNGVVTTLPTLSGPNAAANGISDNGLIAGASNNAAGKLEATLWRNGTANDLGVLPGGLYSEAIDVNNNGVAVGVSTLNGGTYFAGERHATVFQNGTATDLTPELGPRQSSGATDINSAGQVLVNGATGSFIWQDGMRTDIRTLIPASAGVVFSTAWALNDNGQIAITGRLASDAVGTRRMFVLTP